MSLTSIKQKLNKFANIDPVKLQPTHPLTERDGESESRDTNHKSATASAATPNGSGGKSGAAGDNVAGKEGMSEEQRRAVKVWLRENRDLNRWGGGPGGAI
jgi:hypothetical protein